MNKILKTKMQYQVQDVVTGSNVIQLVLKWWIKKKSLPFMLDIRNNIKFTH